MSFLLDALRKSEQAGRQRSAPTIHSATPSGSYGPRNGGEDLLPILAFVAPAFLLMTWFGLRMFDLDSMASKTADERDPVSITQAKPAGVPDDRSGSVGSSTAKPTSRAPQFIGTDRDPEPIPRTPVEQIEQASAPVRIPGEARTAQPGSSTAEDLEAASRAIERAVADVERQAEQPASPRSDPADTEAAARNLSAAAVSGRRNYIDFWELPDNVRSDLPEMRLSVMVYAEQPEDRFVLLNGQRLYEGDELQPGLVVSEVRRDGVIFSFRRYRFIYPQ